jgi:antitoxin Phd
MATWQLQEAKAKFSEVVRLAANEPQEITVHGESKVVVIASSEYQKLKRAKKQLPLGEFLRSSPLTGLNLEFTRDKSLPRDISLD